MRHARFIAFCIILGAGFAAGLGALRPEIAFITAFDLAALVFIGSSVPLWLRDGDIESDDGGRLLLPIVAVIAVLAVLLSVGRMMGVRAALTVTDAGMIAATLALAWVFANLVLAFHYARMDDGTGEIAFPGPAAPTFSDYVYCSFVIGMTCQTADVTMASARMRRVAVLHGIGAFFFNLGVLALSINVLSGIL